MNKDVKEWAIAALVGITAALVIRFFIAETVRIEGSSMLPTFQNNDIVMVEKISYRNNEPEIGDIVIIKLKNEDKTIIKRIVGLPGDVIEIKEGELYRNGKRVEEKFIKENIKEAFPKTNIEKNQIFAMGDNRNASSDSRVYGPFEYNQIQGKVWLEIKDNFGERY